MPKKRGSLSLSVNAIVVLILAIVMLGLGMAFIRGMFGQVSETFEQKVAEEPEPAVPTIRAPISFSREHLITHSAVTEVIKVAIFNPTNQSWTNAKPVITCPEGAMESDANAQTINSNSYEDYTMKVKLTGAPDIYLCKLSITATIGDPSAYTEDITIEVRD